MRQHDEDARLGPLLIGVFAVVLATVVAVRVAPTGGTWSFFFLWITAWPLFNLFARTRRWRGRFWLSYAMAVSGGLVQTWLAERRASTVSLVLFALAVGAAATMVNRSRPPIDRS